MISFKYQEHQGQFYPSVDIELSHLGRTVVAEALVDSGADVSLFRAEYADALGLPVERGEKLQLKGIGGEVTCYRHVVTFCLAGTSFVVPFIFLANFGFA